ncbi:MAG: metallophosphoesterase [Acidobacteriota bacterium]
MNFPRRRFLCVLGIVCLILLSSTCDSGVRFAVVADIQYHPGKSLGTRYYSVSLAKLQECLSRLNKEGLRFVINLGDTIDHDFKSFERVMPLWKKLKAPLFHVLGNHDFDFPEASEDRVLSALKMKQAYHAFSRGKWRFIVLHGFELRFPFPQDEMLANEAEALYLRLRAEGREHAQRWNGGIGRKQMDFLRSELEDAERSRKNVLVFCHFPVLPEAAHNLWNDREMVELLKAFPTVKAYFSGHNHEGDYILQDGIHYLTFQGMVETADSSAFAVVSLEKNAIKIKGFGREPSRTLRIHTR